MHTSEFQNLLLKAATKKGFQAAEVYIAGGRSLEVRVFEEKISHYESSRQRGISFRGQIKDKMGYAFSEKIDPEIIPWLLEEAASNAQVLSDTEKEDLFAGEPYTPSASYSEILADVKPQQLIDTALNLEKGAKEADSRIRSVEYALAEYVESERSIANTLGLSAHEQSNLFLAFAMARAKDEQGLKQGMEFWHGRDLDTLNAEQIGQAASRRALSLLGARPVKSAQLPVLLEQRAATDLLKTFLPVFFADKVQQGFSLLSSKTGQNVAAACVDLVDAPRHPASFNQPAFDSEGVSTRHTSLIESGILSGFLHNRKTAAKAGVSSTGNGFKPSWKAGIQVAATNCLISPGKASFSQLQNQLNKGLQITSLSGLHAGTNQVSGDFSLSAEGYWLENGRIVHPVDQITVAGNFYDLLKQIQAVADDLYFDFPGGSGQVGCPSLLIDPLSISGE